MVGCRQTTNSALGGGNIFNKRGSAKRIRLDTW